MRHKKVLLANLISHEAPSFKKRAVLKAGLGYIAQTLYDNQVDYKVVDLSLGYGLEHLLKEISRFSPELVGIPLSTYRHNDAYNIIRQIKKIFPNIKIVCGGPHVSTLAEAVLKDCPEIDFGVVGEGDETIIDLCSGIDYNKIPGLIYRKNGEVFVNEKRPYIQNLNKLNFPRYINFELEHYPLRNSPISERIIPIVSSRGCPYDCIYCPVQTAIGQKFRFRDVFGIIEEIEYWYNLGYRRFSFVDDNFSLLRERIVSLCEQIEKNGLKNLILSLPNGIRADKVDYELLKKMYSVGFKYIGLGVESGNEQILKILKKHETVETIDTAIKNACEIGYFVDLYFLVGSPGETEKEVMDSVKLGSKYPVDNVFYFNLIPYPKTELFEWIKQNGHFIYPPEYYLNKIHSNMDKPVFETKDFSVSARKKMLKFAREFERKRKFGQYLEKLNTKNITGFMAFIIATIYSKQTTQRIFNDVKFFRKLKQWILKSRFFL